MLFNSHIFLLLFLPVAVTGYWALARTGRPSLPQLWLLGCSLTFYAWWNVAYLPLLLGSMLVNFVVSRLLLRRPSPPLLWAGIAFNLSLLGYFKYANFLLANFAALTERPFSLHESVLPLAVSFFSLQQIVFLVDTYQGLCGRVSALKYSVYVSFFPHLIAGPIVLHNELIPQLGEGSARNFEGRLGTQGILLLAVGLLKKLAIADTLSLWARAGFDGSGPLSLIAAWTASLAYTFQLYFDFSGYSDMAVGVALLFHFRLPVNFRSPYRSRNMISFWQTWHITLSRFITNYLYVPMLRGFGRITFTRSMIATLLAMLIAGLWHGADWRFLVFGLFHGAGLVANHLWKKRKLRMPAALAWGLTFFWVNLAFVFFRAPSWAAVGRMLGGMFHPAGWGSLDPLALLFLLLAAGIIFVAPNSETIQAAMERVGGRWAALSGVALAVALVALEFQNANEFLYYKF